MTIKIILSAIVAILVFHKPVYAQDIGFDFIPSRDYSIHKSNPALLQNLKLSFDSLVLLSKDKNKKTKKLITESYKELYDDIYISDTADFTMYKDTLVSYLYSILTVITNSNKELTGNKYTLLLNRSDDANAFSYSAGVIIVNLDIIAKMKSEDELAFILAHELSHDYLKHVQNGIVHTAELVNSDEVQNEIKKLKRQQYGTFKSYKEFMAKFTFKRTSHSRQRELEADSLGLIFLSNTKYSHTKCLSAINTLDSIDNNYYRDKLNIKKHFEFDDLKLDEKYFVREGDVDLGKGNLEEYKRPDSLKTHPDCKIRAKQLSEILTKNNLLNDNKRIDNNLYNKLALRSRLELIETWFNTKQYGLALYNCLHMADIYPNNQYIQSMIVNSLVGLYHAQMKHNFYYSVDIPDNKNDKAYNDYLVFMHNTNPNLLKKLALKYFIAHVIKKENDNLYEFTETLIASMGLPEKELNNIPNVYKNKQKDLFYTDKLYSIFVRNY